MKALQHGPLHLIVPPPPSPAGANAKATLARVSAAGGGLWASGTDRLSVRHVTSERNGNWGFAEELSVEILNAESLIDRGGEGR